MCGVSSCAEHNYTVNDFVFFFSDFRGQPSWETGVTAMMQNSEFNFVTSCLLSLKLLLMLLYLHMW